jgi:hypothetical protein
MSLNRALGELFKVIREEAAANPDFALKLEEALGTYRPSKRAKDAARARAGGAPRPTRLPPAPVEDVPPEQWATPIAPSDAAPDGPPVTPTPIIPATPDLNPIAFLTREGEDALRQELETGPYSAAALAALASEHNLDPAGEAEGADRQGWIEQIITQAKKRLARDAKLFEY